MEHTNSLPLDWGNRKPNNHTTPNHKRLQQYYKLMMTVFSMKWKSYDDWSKIVQIVHGILLFRPFALLHYYSWMIDR